MPPASAPDLAGDVLEAIASGVDRRETGVDGSPAHEERREAGQVEEFRALLEQRIVLLDCAMGTMIQSYGLSEEDYRGSASPTIQES